MIERYLKAAAGRENLGIPPKPLTAEQTAGVCRMLETPPEGREALLRDLLIHRVPPGVDEAAKIKANFLGAVAAGEKASPVIDACRAAGLLGTMLGGYNIPWLISFLNDSELAPEAVAGLVDSIFIFDAYRQVGAMAAENSFARQVVQAWKAAV